VDFAGFYQPDSGCGSVARWVPILWLQVLVFVDQVTESRGLVREDGVQGVVQEDGDLVQQMQICFQQLLIYQSATDREAGRGPQCPQGPTCGCEID
jgi:hypothetical protein